jgi:hypothetical protein
LTEGLERTGSVSNSSKKYLAIQAYPVSSRLARTSVEISMM